MEAEAMEPELSGYTSAGLVLHPAKSIDEAACLIESAAAVPAHIPSRGEYIKQRLHAVGSSLASAPALALQMLAERVGLTKPALAIVSSLPPSNGIVFLTDRERCVVHNCGGMLRVQEQGAKKAGARHSNPTRHAPTTQRFTTHLACADPPAFHDAHTFTRAHHPAFYDACIVWKRGNTPRSAKNGSGRFPSFHIRRHMCRPASLEMPRPPL